VPQRWFECLCELRAGVELPRWYRLLEYCCCAGLPISLPEGKGRLRRLAFHVRDGKNARTSIHLILPILRDRRLSSLSIPLTQHHHHHPSPRRRPRQTPSPPLCACISPAPPTRYAPSAAVLPKLPFLPLRLQRLLLLLYYYYTAAYYYFYRLVLYLLAVLVLPCLPACQPASLILRLLPHSTLHTLQPSPAQPSIATCCPHPRLTTVLERILLHVRACIIPAQASRQHSIPTGSSTPAACVPRDLLYRLPCLVLRQTPQHPLRSPQSRWREPASHRWSIPSAAIYISAFFALPSWFCEATLVQPYLPGRPRCLQSTMPRAMLTE